MTDNDSEVVETKLISNEKKEWLPKTYAFDPQVDKTFNDLAAQEKELNSRVIKTIDDLRRHSADPKVVQKKREDDIEKTMEVQNRIIEGLG